MIRLYHFVPAFLLGAVRREGLTMGHVPRSYRGRVGLVEGYQWLTSEPAFGQQHWATRHALGYSRTAFRFTVDLPNDEQLHRWHDIGRLLAADLFDELNSVGGSDSWWLHDGPVPASSLTEVVKAGELVARGGA